MLPPFATCSACHLQPFRNKTTIKVKYCRVRYVRIIRFRKSSVTNGDDDGNADENAASSQAPNSGEASSAAPESSSQAPENAASSAAPNDASTGPQSGENGASSQAPQNGDDRSDEPTLPEGQESEPGKPFKFSCGNDSVISEVRIRSVFVNRKRVLLFRIKTKRVSVQKQVSWIIHK